jgi:hypothetical protein
MKKTPVDCCSMHYGQHLKDKFDLVQNSNACQEKGKGGDVGLLVKKGFFLNMNLYNTIKKPTETNDITNTGTESRDRTLVQAKSTK